MRLVGKEGPALANLPASKFGDGLGQQLNGQHVGRYEFDSGGNFNRSWPDLSDDVYALVKGKLGADEKENIALIRQALAAAVAEINVETEFDSLRKTLLSLSITAWAAWMPVLKTC